jgi:hypothetical protein
VIRPTCGTLTRLDGTVVELRVVPTEHPLVFLAVNLDGERVPFHRGDHVVLDALGPQQSVILADRVEP